MTASAVALLGTGLAACGSSGTLASSPPAHGSVDPVTRPLAASTESTTRLEYVDGHFVPFSTTHPLSSVQWDVVNAYARFSTAALQVYQDHSVLPLADVVSSTSKVSSMFQRFLDAHTNPEALSTRAQTECATARTVGPLALRRRQPRGRGDSTLRHLTSTEPDRGQTETWVGQDWVRALQSGRRTSSRRVIRTPSQSESWTGQCRSTASASSS